MDPIHIGVVAYPLASGWPVIRLEGAYRVDTKRVWSAMVRIAELRARPLATFLPVWQDRLKMRTIGSQFFFTRAMPMRGA